MVIGSLHWWPNQRLTWIDDHRKFQNGIDPGCQGFGVFDTAVPSGFDKAFKEHGLTEDGKTVAPIFVAFCAVAESEIRIRLMIT